MGESNDDVTGVFTVAEREWVDEMLQQDSTEPAAVMTVTGGSGGDPNDPPDPAAKTDPEPSKGPTPAELLLAEINAPRPADLCAPDGANPSETEAINTLHGQLVTHLERHDASLDLTEAHEVIRQIRDLVAEVPNRILRDIETRRGDLRLALATVPTGLPDIERLPLLETRDTLDGAITTATTLDALSGVATKAQEFAAVCQKAEISVGERKLRAETLGSRIDKAPPPEDAQKEEKDELIETVKTLRTRLLPPHSDDALGKVETDVTLLEEAIQKLAEAVRLRAERAEKLGERFALIKPAPGLHEDEAKPFREAVVEAAKVLAAHCSDATLNKTEEHTALLEGEVIAQAQTVEDRANRSKDLTLRLDAIAAPPRVMETEKVALDEVVTKAKLLLAPPHAVSQLDGVEKCAGELEGDAKVLADTVIQRDLRAQKVLDRVALLTDPAGLNDTEKDNLKKANDAATNLLDDPPTDKALGDAEVQAGEAEVLHAAITKAISDRAVKRKELTDALDKIDIPATARPADFRLHATIAAALRKTIADANTTETLQKAEEGGTAEVQSVKDMAAFLIARAEAETELAEARKTQKAEEKSADQGFLSMLAQTIIETAKALPRVSDTAEVAKSRKELADIVAKLGPSKAYADDLRTFLTSANIALKSADPVTAETIIDATNKVRLAAQEKAKTLDYDGARLEFLNFETEAGLGEGALAAGTLWLTTLKTFATLYEAKLTLIEKSKVPDGAPTLLSDLKTKQVVPPLGADMTAAANALNDLGAKINLLHDVAVLWLRYQPLVNKTPPLPLTGVDKAISEATVDLSTNKYAEARGRFASLSGSATEKKGDATARLAKLQTRNGQIGMRLPAPEKTLVKPLLTAARTKLKQNKPDEATVEMDKAETLMNDLEAWATPYNHVKALAALHDAPNAYGFTTAAATKATQLKFGEAISLLQTPATKLKTLGEVETLKPRVATLRDAQTTGKPPHQACVKALVDCQDALATNKDPVKALGVLNTLLADPALKKMAADIAVWMARKPLVDKATKRVTDMMSLSAPKKVVTDSLSSAETKATAHDYEGALDLLDAHETKLKDARAYVVARERALAVHAALLRAEGDFKTKTEQEIFGATGKAGVQADIDDSEKLASKDDMAAATKAFDAFLKALKPQLTVIAKLSEEMDGDGTNAGHSLDSHGPDVTEDELLFRLQTGKAPGNRDSFCTSSSQFEDIGAWLASRERAIKEVEGRGVDLTVKSYPIPSPPPVKPNPDTVLEQSVIVDHGGPIDKALSGLKADEGVLPNGTLGELKTFETYERLTGVTKSTVKMVFVIDSPDDDPARPYDLKAYRERFDAKAEKDEIALATQNETAVSVHVPVYPTSVPGRWVVMQNFPVAKNWDQEAQDYVV